MKKLTAVWLLFLAFEMAVFAQKCPKKVRLPSILPEISGLARRPDGTFWAANDSGNPAVLWQIDCRGRAVASVDLSKKIRNTDWEELAFDPKKGRLVISDFGNNLNARRDLALHLFDEKTGAVETVFFALEDQTAFPPPEKKDWNFNLEAMVVVGDSAHLFSKNEVEKGDFVCKHYSVALEIGRQTARLHEKIDLKNRVVTGAALSPDGQRLALVGYRFGRRFGVFPFSKATIFEFDSGGSTAFFSGKMSRQKAPYFWLGKQWESLQFIDNQRVMLANERFKFQKPKLRTVRLRKN